MASPPKIDERMRSVSTKGNNFFSTWFKSAHPKLRTRIQRTNIMIEYKSFEQYGYIYIGIKIYGENV